MRAVKIGGHDLSAFRIVLPKEPKGAEKTGSAFLQKALLQSSGLLLPIVSEPAEHSIFIGGERRSERIRWDGFCIQTDDRNLYLFGNEERGTLYACYEFAESRLGYRYFAVGVTRISCEGEVQIPSGLDEIHNPGFEVRRVSWADLAYDPEFASHARVNSHLEADMEAYGGTVYDFIPCHTFYQYCPADEYFREHPEYYSERDGKRIPCRDAGGPGQLCLTNPDVLRIVTNRILEELREHPERKLIDFSQCDCGNYCQCEKCAAVDAEEESPAGSIVRFVNAVAEAVEREFPDVLVQTFAYDYSVKPPKFTKARKNVLIRYCTFDACFRHALDDTDCEINSATVRPEMLGWKDCCSQLSLWDYLSNYNCYLAPFPNLYSLWKNASFYAECGVRHLYESMDTTHSTTGPYGDLKAYLAAKLCWNPTVSKEDYLIWIDEFLEAFYGPGWEDIRSYLKLELETTEGRCFTCKEPIDICFLYYKTIPEVPNLKRFLRRSYTAKPYQPVYPNHALSRLCERLDEAKGCFDRAYEKAETDLQRYRIKRSRIALTYLDLFCTEHDETAMTPAERNAYEAEVEQFYRDKKAYNYYYNIHTEFMRN